MNPWEAVSGVKYLSSNQRWGGEVLTTLVNNKNEKDIDTQSPRMAAPGYTIVDILAHWDVSKILRVNVGLFNVTDKRHIRLSVSHRKRFCQPGLNIAASFRVEL